MSALSLDAAHRGLADVHPDLPKRPYRTTGQGLDSYERVWPLESVQNGHKMIEWLRRLFHRKNEVEPTSDLIEFKDIQYAQFVGTGIPTPKVYSAPVNHLAIEDENDELDVFDVGSAIVGISDCIDGESSGDTPSDPNWSGGGGDFSGGGASGDW